MQLEELRTQREAYLKFLKFINVNFKKAPIKISIEFQSHRFKDTKGFATISLPSSYTPRLQNIVNAIEDAVERDLDDILKEIKEINPTFEYFNKEENDSI